MSLLICTHPVIVCFFPSLHLQCYFASKFIPTGMLFFTSLLRFLSTFHSHGRSEVKARQDVKPDFRHPPFTDYRQPPVDYRHPPVTDYRQPPTLDYRHPPGLLDFRQHPAAAQFPLGIPADFRPQVELDQELSAYVDRTSFICMQVCNLFQLYLS